MKKILVDGLKIQEKNDGFEDSKIFTNELFNALFSEFYDLEKIKIKYSNGEVAIKDFDGVCEVIASKNLPMVYLNDKSNIEITNDYATYELIK